jgi:hypothetical protein
MDEQKQSYTLLTIVVVAILAIAAGVLWYTMRAPADNFDFDGATTTPRDSQDRTPSGQSENIIIYAPRMNERVGTPIIIEGRARVFENTVNYRLRDASGKEIAEGFITADAPDIDQFGPFRAELTYLSTVEGAGFIDIFSLSAMDGSEINMVSIPVTFTKTPEFING